jgi:aminopeptidase
MTINTVDEELIPGARNAIRICLKLQPNERITIITDEETRDIAEALQNEVEEISSPHSLFVLEDYGSRPMIAMPSAILGDLAQSQVSIFCAQSQPGELAARMQMSAVVNKNRIRHGHMVNISREIMLEGMRADFTAIDEFSERLVARARKAKKILCRTPAGTDYEAEFSPDLKWLKTSGIIHPDKWGNLPGGEIFTSPKTSDGTFIVDGVVGDYLCQKYGDLRDNPVTIRIKDSRIVDIECPRPDLLEEFRAYTSTDENSNRVGEFAIGTNMACTHVIGNILQDEKIPGIHIAFGHPYAEHTGAKWFSKTHIDCVGRDFDIFFDGEAIMRAGKFVI